MIINLNELPNAGDQLHLTDELKLREITSVFPEFPSVKPVQVQLDFVMAIDTLMVTGECVAHLQLTCSRCLLEFLDDVHMPIEERFVFRDQEEDLLNEEDDQGFADLLEEIVPESVKRLDLRPYIIENVISGIPEFPLCNEHCLGLCAVCGTNKNEHNCECQLARIDPRLEALKQFFDE